MILEVTDFTEKYNKETEKIVRTMGKPVVLHTIIATDNECCKTYVRNKKVLAEKVGIVPFVVVFDNPKEIDTDKLIEKVKLLSTSPNVQGMLIQSPTFDHIDYNKVVNCIASDKDVDGLTDENIKRLHSAKSHTLDKNLMIPCTAKGICEFIKYLTDGKTEDLNVVIVGRSELVGNPLEKVLRDHNCNVTVLHSRTSKDNMMKYFDNADYIVSAVGKPNFRITEDFFKKDKKVTILDVGMQYDENGKAFGDCDKALYDHTNITVTRTPRGTAQLTLAMLMRNTVLGK